jgi:hypothetical protein
MDKTFLAKVMSIQGRLNAPKKRWNDYGKFYYRGLEDILSAAKPLLSDQGLLLTVTDELVSIDGRFYVKAVATITDGENSLTNTAYARESDGKKGMDSSQVTGTASTYARKYCLNGLFLIDDSYDPDSNEYHKRPHPEEQNEQNGQNVVPPPDNANPEIPYPHSGEKKRAKPKKMTAKAVDTLVQILMDEKTPLDKFMAQYGISELKELPFEVYEKVYKDHTQKAVQDA